jgi:hypothetical protein
MSGDADQKGARSATGRDASTAQLLRNSLRYAYHEDHGLAERFLFALIAVAAVCVAAWAASPESEPISSPDISLFAGVLYVAVAIWFIWGDLRRPYSELIDDELYELSRRIGNDRTTVFDALGARTSNGRTLRRSIAFKLFRVLAAFVFFLWLGFTLLLAAKSRFGAFEPSHEHSRGEHWGAWRLTLEAGAHLVRVGVNAIPGLDVTDTLYWNRDPWPWHDVLAGVLSTAFLAMLVFALVKQFIRGIQIVAAEHWRRMKDTEITPERWEEIMRRGDSISGTATASGGAPVAP